MAHGYSKLVILEAGKNQNLCSEVLFTKMYLMLYQNSEILIFFTDIKKKILLPGNVRMNCLHMLEPKDFSLLCYIKSNTTLWISLKLFFISWNCCSASWTL